MLGLPTVEPLCRGNLVGGLQGVMVSLMGTRRCSPTQDVWVGERLVFAEFANNVLCSFNAESRMIGMIEKVMHDSMCTVPTPLALAST